MPEELKYANLYGWSDIHPYEIIRRVSEKTIEVRMMMHHKDDSWKPEIIAGGFAGHCINQSEQRWTYSSYEDNPIRRIRKGKNGWKDGLGNLFRLSESPRYYYDYNF